MTVPTVLQLRREFVQKILNSRRISQEKKNMDMAAQYYGIQNDIVNNKIDKTQQFTDRSKHWTDLQAPIVPSSLVRSAVDYHTNYGAGKPVVVNIFSENNEIKEETEKLLKKTMSNGFNWAFRKIVFYAKNYGIGWGFIKVEDKIKLIPVDPRGMFPIWADENQTELLSIVREYDATNLFEYTINQKIIGVEYWIDGEITYFYQIVASENSSLIQDKQTRYGDLLTKTEFLIWLETQRVGSEELAREIVDNMIEKENINNVEQFYTTGEKKFPFIFIESSYDRRPPVTLVKNAIDELDMLVSTTIEVVKSSLYYILHITGIGGDKKELEEALKTAKNKRIIGSKDTQARVSFVKNDYDISKNLEIIEKLVGDVNQTLRIFDAKTQTFGRDVSGVALRLLNSLTDIEINFLEGSVRNFFDDFLWFFYRKYKIDGEQLEVTVALNRDMTVNELEQAQMAQLLSQSQIIPVKNILNNLPDSLIQDTEEAMKQLEADYNVGGIRYLMKEMESLTKPKEQSTNVLNEQDEQNEDEEDETEQNETNNKNNQQN